MTCTRVFSVFALQLCVVSTVFAQASVNSTATVDQHRTLNYKDVGGVVIGQTITLAGRAVYDSFASAWSEKDEREISLSPLLSDLPHAWAVRCSSTTVIVAYFRCFFLPTAHSSLPSVLTQLLRRTRHFLTTNSHSFLAIRTWGATNYERYPHALYIAGCHQPDVPIWLDAYRTC